MSPFDTEQTQFVTLAADRHARLLVEAETYRLLQDQPAPPPHTRSWRRWRYRLGEWLIAWGQRLKTDAAWT